MTRLLAYAAPPATTVNQLYAIRFLTALVDSSTFSGTQCVASSLCNSQPFTHPFPFSSYILGCWYAPSELGKRSAIFAASAQMGSLFSGLMQGAIHSNMDGAKGLAGWRWLFIIEGAGSCFLCSSLLSSSPVRRC